MTAAHLKEKNMWMQIPGLIVKSGFKYMGYQLGKRYKQLPKALVVKCSAKANREYWNKG